MAAKTYHRPIAFTDTVSSAEAGAGLKTITIYSNVPEDGTDDFRFVLEVKNSDSKIKTDGLVAKYNSNSGTLRVTNRDTSSRCSKETHSFRDGRNCHHLHNYRFYIHHVFKTSCMLESCLSIILELLLNWSSSRSDMERFNDTHTVSTTQDCLICTQRG